MSIRLFTQNQIIKLHIKIKITEENALNTPYRVNKFYICRL
jgi:hypothetical protein